MAKIYCSEDVASIYSNVWMSGLKSCFDSINKTKNETGDESFL